MSCCEEQRNGIGVELSDELKVALLGKKVVICDEVGSGVTVPGQTKTANCGGFVVDYNKTTNEERPLQVLKSIRDREWG